MDKHIPYNLHFPSMSLAFWGCLGISSHVWCLPSLSSCPSEGQRRCEEILSENLTSLGGITWTVWWMLLWWLFSWENIGKTTIHGRFFLRGFHQGSSMKMIWLYNWLIFPMGHPLLGESLCFWGNLYNVRPPSDVSWFISPSNYSFLRTINHSYWSYVHQLGYRTGASHCRGFPVWWHRMVFESTTCLNNTMNVNDMEDRGSQWPVAFDVWYEHTR